VAKTGARTKEFASAEQFLNEYQRDERGCVVLDFRLNGMNGLELQQRLAEAGDPLPVVVITGHADVPMAVKALQLGAASFLEKPFSNADLLHAVEQALEAAEKAHLAAAERRAIKERLSQLTPNELAVFAHLIEGRQNKAIAAALSLGVRTVESRRASIMKKMQAASLAELVRMAICVNWKPEDAAE
jgi:FixJ family two-component response regulator